MYTEWLNDPEEMFIVVFKNILPHMFLDVHLFHLYIGLFKECDEKVSK